MQALPILMYHHVSPAPGLVTVAPETFRAHMAWLALHGYTTVGCQDVGNFLAGQPLPKKSIVVSFDDGYLDNWVYAHPVLQEFGQKAVLFLATGWLGDGPVRPAAGSGHPLPQCPDHRQCKALIGAGQADEVVLRWSEVEAMISAGTFEFHSHTHTHTRWDKTIVPGDERDVALGRDLHASREMFQQRLGAVSEHLCWPQGYYDGAYIRIAKEAGFRYLYTTEKRVNVSAADPLRLGRVVTKELPASWLGNRAFIWRHGTLAKIYAGLRGK